jgi:hypothetical protein
MSGVEAKRLDEAAAQRASNPEIPPALAAGVGAQRADNRRLGDIVGRSRGGFRRRSPPRPGLIAAAQA